MAKKKHQQTEQQIRQQKQNAAKAASGSKGTAKKTARKERGTLLTIFIIVIGVHAVLATYIGYVTLQQEYKTPWGLPLLTLVSLVAIVGAVGMWYWKKWGIYLYAFVCITQAAVHLAMTGSMLVVFYDILPLSIVAYVVNLQDKQKLFD